MVTVRNGGIAAAVCAMGLVLVGCTPNRPYRTNFDPVGGDRTKAVIEDHPDYKLGFVELDDQGYFWCMRQREAVEQMICDAAGIPFDAGRKAKPEGKQDGTTQPAAAKGIVLVAFVHGWKDNAEYGNSGVDAFGQILQQLSATERAQTDHPPRQVAGVYVGWRGLSATWEPFKELSFWERKDTAHKVGGYGALTRLLVELEDLQKRSLDALPPDAPRTELIIIGHSFGGAAVYSALSQIIAERFVNSLEKGKRLKPLGDQVILLNPAFEAQRHYDLNQMAIAVDKYPPDQRPVLSVFTSKGDWATHDLFPIGRWFATLFQSNRDPAQALAGRETIGWYRPFLTHELRYRASTTQPSSPTATFNPATAKHEYPDQPRMRASFERVKAERGKWRPNGPKAQTYSFDDAVLQPINGYRPGDPFLIVSVDPQIMADHDDITNPVLINFIREYIEFSRVEVKDHSK